MNRKEHLEWCKERAREYLKMNDPAEAVTSMLSDLTKHPATEGLARSLGMVGISSMKSVEEARSFIEGFR